MTCTVDLRPVLRCLHLRADWSWWHIVGVTPLHLWVLRRRLEVLICKKLRLEVVLRAHGIDVQAWRIVIAQGVYASMLTEGQSAHRRIKPRRIVFKIGEMETSIVEIEVAREIDIARTRVHEIIVSIL